MGGQLSEHGAPYEFFAYPEGGSFGVCTCPGCAMGLVRFRQFVGIATAGDGVIVFEGGDEIPAREVFDELLIEAWSAWLWNGNALAGELFRFGFRLRLRQWGVDGFEVGNLAEPYVALPFIESMTGVWN